MSARARNTGIAGVPDLDEQLLPPRIDPLESTLGNGLRVIALGRASTPLVEVRLALPAVRAGVIGGRLRRALASSLYTGTEPASVNASVWKLGGELQVSQDPWHLQVLGRVPGTALGAFLRQIARPLADPGHKAAGTALDTATAAPARRSPWEQLHQELQRRRTGTVAEDGPTEQTPTAQEIQDAHHDLIRPEGAVLVLVGDLDPQDAVASAARAFGGWQEGAPAVCDPPPRPAPHPGLAVLEYPGLPQACFALALPGVNRDDSAYPALQLAELVFGGALSGRLQRSLRGESGYVYSVTSRFEFAPADAIRLISSATRHETAVCAVSTALSEIRRMRTEPPEEAEVRAARDYAVGMASVAGATQAAQAQGLLQQARAGLPARWLEHHLRRLRRVTTEEVRAVAGSFFSETQVAGALTADIGHVDTAALRESASAAGLPFEVKQADEPPPGPRSSDEDPSAVHRKVPER